MGCSRQKGLVPSPRMSDQSSIEHTMTQAYDDYADAIFRHCYYRLGNRETAKDIVHDTFVKVWEYLKKGKEVENIRALLYRSATNLIIDHVRKHKKRQEQSLETMQEDGWDVAANENEEQLQAKLDAEQIAGVFSQIDETYREVLIMRYVDELPPREIAELTGLDTNVISVRINRGMKQLKSLLPNDHEAL